MKIRLALLLAWFGLAACAAEPSLDFVHMSDIHLADLAGVRPELAKMRGSTRGSDRDLRTVLTRLATPPSPGFALLTGDIIDAWCYDGAGPAPVFGQLRLFKSIHDTSKVPLFLVLGNHDIERYRYDPAKTGPVGDQSVAPEARREWSKTFRCFRRGTYYTFRKQVGRTAYRFLVLDNGDVARNPKYAEEQLNWAARQLAGSGRDNIIVAMHVPFKDDTPFFTRLKSVLARNPRVALVLAGHRHTDGIEAIDLGGRILPQVRTAALRAGDGKWRLIRLFKDRIQVQATGEPEKTVRTIPLGQPAPCPSCTPQLAPVPSH